MVGAGTSPGPTRQAFSLKNNSLPRIPALQARGPGGLRGHTVDTPVSAGIDIWPTLVDGAGYEESAPLSGHSWKAALYDDTPYMRPPVIAEHPCPSGPHQGRSWVMIREGDWKLVADKESLEIITIHNLARDPCELQELDEDAPEGVKARLYQHLKDWQQNS
jgi:arylsulfatase A-like enzyme